MIEIWCINKKKWIWSLKGHLKKYIYSIVKLNKKHLDSASDDDIIKIWDIDSKNCVFTSKNFNQGVNNLIKIDNDTLLSRIQDVISTIDINTLKSKGNFAIEGGVSYLVKFNKREILVFL